MKGGQQFPPIIAILGQLRLDIITRTRRALVGQPLEQKLPGIQSSHRPHRQRCFLCSFLKYILQYQNLEYLTKSQFLTNKI